MPNAIKYSATSESRSLRSGNFYLGVGDVGKGPTSSTDYWNGISPGCGYSVYLNKASQGPSIHRIPNDSQMISFTNTIEFSTLQEAESKLNEIIGWPIYSDCTLEIIEDEYGFGSYLG